MKNNFSKNSKKITIASLSTLAVITSGIFVGVEFNKNSTQNISKQINLADEIVGQGAQNLIDQIIKNKSDWGVRNNSAGQPTLDASIGELQFINKIINQKSSQEIRNNSADEPILVARDFTENKREVAQNIFDKIMSKEIVLDAKKYPEFVNKIAAYSANGVDGYSEVNNILSATDTYCVFPLWNSLPPGFKLQAKIVILDCKSNSNYAKVSFNLGVSDVNGGEILWIDNLNGFDPRDSLFELDFKVLSFEQKVNCANNLYYPGELQLPYHEDEFNEVGIAKRKSIAELLANAPVDEKGNYAFDAQHPYLVDVKAIDMLGVPKPDSLFTTGSTVLNHTNEKVMLAISGVNEKHMVNDEGKFDVFDVFYVHRFDKSNSPYRFKNEIPYVEAKWVVVDSSIGSLNKYEFVKAYQWLDLDNGSVADVLPIYFSA